MDHDFEQDSLRMFPRGGDRQTCHLKTVITSPNITVGDYTYYHDFVDPTRFEQCNVLYHYPVNADRLVIGKFCSIASGAKFLFNGGNHKKASFVNYPFAIFYDIWPEDRPVTADWDNHGDIVVGNDVWIGFEALIMAGVSIGDGARIASRAIVTHDVAPYSVVAGSPAREVSRRFDADTIAKLLALKWWDWDRRRIAENIEVLTSGDLTRLDGLLR